MDELNTIRKTAERARAEGLGVSETAIRSWIAAGALPFVPVGNRRLVFWPALLRFLDQGQTVDTTPRPRYGAGSGGRCR